jgi:predicted nucleotidyltransferase/uncharacterized protein (UPF0332 family)
MIRKSLKDKRKKEKNNFSTLNLKNESDITRDFAVKVYKKFDKIIKSIVLFGSSTKGTSVIGSDIDILILIDDVSIHWDQELISWYREELEKIIRENPYKKSLHINTIKLSSWWRDLIRGDPTLLNMIRYGEEIIDIAGFFNPIKHLLINGEIKSTPEAIYNCLNKAPIYLRQSKNSELSAVEGLFWAMVNSAHAALIAAKVSPPSPEHIPAHLKSTFVNNKILDIKYIKWYREIITLHKEISHGKINDIKGVDIDLLQKKTEEFMDIMIKIVDSLIK